MYGGYLWALVCVLGWGPSGHMERLCVLGVFCVCVCVCWGVLWVYVGLCIGGLCGVLWVFVGLCVCVWGCSYYICKAMCMGGGGLCVEGVLWVYKELGGVPWVF